MAVAARVELETAADTWTALTGWVTAFDCWSGRRSGLGPHRAGTSKLLLRVAEGTAGVPASLGSVGQPATAQGDRIRVYLRPGKATERLIWLGWVTGVEWSAREIQHYCSVASTDALGRLGATEVDYPQRAAESAGPRIQAILDEAAWPWGQDLDRGATQMINSTNLDVRHGSAAEWAQAVALSDPGVLCARPTLTAPLRFLEEGYTPGRRLVISDQQQSAGVRWQGRPSVEASEDHLVNSVTWTIPGESGRRSRQNDQSVTAYGVRRLDRAYESTETEASTVASNVLRSYAAPVSIPRTATVGLHVEADVAASAAAATVIGDQCTTIISGLDGEAVTSETLVDGVGWRLLPLWGVGVAAHQTLALIPPTGAAVQRAPSLPPLPDLTAPAGHAWTAWLPRADGGSGSFGYTVSGRPSWMSFDASQRRLSGVAPFTGGPWTLGYTATDRNDSSSSASASFDVAALVLPVVLPDPANVTVTSGEAVDVLLPAASGGSGSYTYTASGLPTWATLTGRRIRGTAPSTAKAAVTITYVAADRTTSGRASVTFNLRVVVNPVVLPAVRGVSVAGGANVTIPLPAATGGSGQGFTYQLIGRPSWLTVSNRVASGRAAWAQATYTRALTWRATDRGSGQSAESSFVLTVTIQPVALAGQDDLTVTAATAVNVLLSEASGGSGSYTYTATGLPTWLTLTGRRIKGTAPSSAKAAVTVTYKATDRNTGGTKSVTFDVAVAVPLGAPTWTTVPAGRGTLDAECLDLYRDGRVVGCYPVYEWPSPVFSDPGGYTQWQVEMRGVWAAEYTFTVTAQRPRAVWRYHIGTDSYYPDWPQFWAYPTRFGGPSRRYTEMRVRGITADGTQGPWSKVLTFLGGRPCVVTQRDDFTIPV